MIQKPQLYTSFSLQKAPLQSLSGYISTLSGTVLWESRIATEPAVITMPRQIQQGEEIDTKEDGSTTILFNTVGSILIQPNTQLQFIQTLPTSLVVSQNSGTVTYNLTSTSQPFSVKSLSLITQISNGVSSIKVDQSNSRVTITVLSGFVTAAFNDIHNMSNVVPVPFGNIFIYNAASQKYSLISQ